MITKKQIKKIHTLKNAINLKDEIYRDILAELGVKSSKELSFKEAGKLIKSLENTALEMGVWKTPDKRFESFNNRPDMATAKQLRMLEAMWFQLVKISKEKKEGTYVNSRRLGRRSFRRFLNSKFKVSDLKFLPKDKVSKVRKALTSMINRELNKEKA